VRAFRTCLCNSDYALEKKVF